MSYSTKAYTLATLIGEVASVTGKGDAATVLKTLSPRLGADSVKAAVIDTFLNGKLETVLKGRGVYSTFGSNAKARLLKALRLRKSRRF